jgi:hypothetical protein
MNRVIYLHFLALINEILITRLLVRDSHTHCDTYILLYMCPHIAICVFIML